MSSKKHNIHFIQRAAHRMRVYPFNIYPFVCLLLLFFCSCSNLKKLPAGEKLYTGATIRFTDKPPDKKELRTQLEDLLRPRPNKKFLGMRIRLSLYNLGKPPKGKGLNYLLREKWGEPPVLFSKVRPSYSASVLTNHLQNNGFFHANTIPEVIETDKKGKVIYTVTAGIPYTINNVILPDDSSMLSSFIRTYRNPSLLKKGAQFSLDNIIAERERIDLALKEEGYFYFNPDYILVQVDSTLKGKVNLYITVKEETPKVARQQFYIKDVMIYPNYSLDKDSTLLKSSARKYPYFRLSDPDSLFRPDLFNRSVFLKPDSLYRRSSHNITLRRLVNLGSFKYIRANFERVRRSTEPLLNTTIYLTPYPKRTLQLQLNGSSKSNNFVGSEIKVQALNRNMFRGAENLEINLGAGFETQVGGNQVSTNSYTVNGDVSLSFPRFISPFKLINPRTPFVPRTRITVSYEQLSRTDLYALKAFSGSLGYNWKKTSNWDHTFQPLSFSYALPSNITAEFQDMLNQDISLRQSFDKQFIVGTTYSLRFNNQTTTKNRNAFYADFNADLSGNTLGLLTFKKNTAGQKQLLNVPFSQYLRFTADMRNYWKLNQRSTWANRVVLGYGYAYGNSSSLPFVKQYFIGGSNSLRAFRARTLGPGSYHTNASTLLASESGDIKLETSSELRTKLFSVIQAALFVDAGNIWLRKENPLKPGSGLNDWWKEIAVGAGAGLRVDASILIVRFDFAIPLRKPWLPENERWVTGDIRLDDGQWRKENIVLNIAIGYPF